VTARVVLNRASRARWLARRRKGITATDIPVTSPNLPTEH
jgi:hypothetical protein